MTTIRRIGSMFAAGVLCLAAGSALAGATGSAAGRLHSTADYVRKDWRDLEVLCAPEQLRSGTASSLGCYRGYSQVRFDSFERLSLYVPVRDGTRLAVDVYRPLVDGKPLQTPSPVIFNYSRYWRATERPDGMVDTYVGRLRKGQTQSRIADALAAGRGDDRMGVGLLLAHGYVFVRAEARGTGASFGVRDGDLSGLEARDGADVIAWINRQPWASGKVAMIGGSYEGMSQHLVASTAPKGLVAIFPAVATFDEYRASWSGGGLLRKYGLAWLAREARRDGVQKGVAGSTINPVDTSQTMVASVTADVDGRLREAARRERLGHPDAVNPMSYFTRQSPEAATLVEAIAAALGSTEPGPIMETLYSTEALADLMRRKPGLREQISQLRFYRDRSRMLVSVQEQGPSNLGLLAPRISAAGVAVYNWGGWRDFATIDTLLWDANHRGPKKLTMGPWTHGPNEPNDMREAASAALRPIEQLRWADHWLKGVRNGVMQEPAVHYAVMTEGDSFFWRTAAQWPPAAGAVHVWSLGPGDVLARRPPRQAGARTFTVDYASTLGEHTRYHDAIGLGPMALPDLAAHASRGAAAWTSAPLVADLEIAGSPIADLFVTSSTPDADLHAYLEKVDAAGKVTFLADGEMRASHRRLGKAPYRNLGLPYSDSRKAVVDATPPLNASTPSRVTFDLMPVAARVKRGDRLRLVVTGSDAHTTLTIPLDPPTRLSIHFGQRSPSGLRLPITRSP